MGRSPVMDAVSRSLASLRPGRHGTVVAALSGGADSVALLDALAQAAPGLGIRVVAAHLDHALRAGSADDAAFCAALCARLGVPLRQARVDVAAHARQEGGGLEEAARHARHAFLHEVARAEDAAAILLAHTRDDQAETLLLRLLRGAGSRGLSAMRARQGRLLRPLLGLGRAEVLAYLGARGLAWREDPSNQDPAFARNRVRHELIPYLEAHFNPALRRTLARTAALLADEAEASEAAAAALLDAARVPAEDALVLLRAPLAGAPRALARQALRLALAEAGGLREVGLAHVDRVLALAARPSASGRRLPLPGRREVVCSFDTLRIARPSPPSAAYELPLPVPGRVALPDGRELVAEGTRPETPLVVRTRRPGDRLRLHGREVSLKRFLMQRRVPAGLRGRLPLVAAGPQVLWVQGMPAEAGGGLRVEVRRSRPEACA